MEKGLRTPGGLHYRLLSLNPAGLVDEAQRA